MSVASNEVRNQAEQYDQIIQTWSDMIDENRETIALSDTNLPTQMLLEDGTSGRYDLQH